MVFFPVFTSDSAALLMREKAFALVKWQSTEMTFVFAFRHLGNIKRKSWEWKIFLLPQNFFQILKGHGRNEAHMPPSQKKSTMMLIEVWHNVAKRCYISAIKVCSSSSNK